MKDEHDKSTIDALVAIGESGDIAPESVRQQADKDREKISKILDDALNEDRVSGRRFKGSKTPDNVRQKWQTPKWLFDWARKRFGEFGIDVAAEKVNALCACYLDEETDALRDGVDWGAENGLAWCNPPYAEPMPFVRKAIEQAKKRGVSTVFLVNCDPSTAWFKLALDHASDLVIITSDGETSGRVAFVDAVTGKPGGKNPKSSVLFLIKPRKRGDVKTEYITLTEMMYAGKSLI